jgi:glycosyltransferase involved in cell wall biosynthesis
MPLKIKVCHITSVHPRNDVRIFHKECKSLHQSGYEVSLVVADGLKDEVRDSLSIFDVGKETKRVKRILRTPRKILKKAIEIDADIYHFHDPELIFTGLKLLKKGKKVIYDVHEDVPRQLLTKPYLKGFVKPILAKITERFENRAAKKFSMIVAATDFIRDRFLKINPRSISVKNFPIVKEFEIESDYNIKPKAICYIGSISEVRGIKEIITSMQYLDCKMNLAGTFNTPTLRAEVSKIPGWEKVKEFGFVDRDQTKKILEDSRVGLVTLYPTINYKDSLPVKMFEYMMAGIPYVASNIELWQQITTDNNCGLTANPYDPKDIAQKVNELLKHPEKAKEMGLNGKKAVIEKFNWDKEFEVLLKFYNAMLDFSKEDHV